MEIYAGSHGHWLVLQISLRYYSELIENFSSLNSLKTGL